MARTLISNLKGAKGDTGIAGAGGPASDAATATYLGTFGTATRAAWAANADVVNVKRDFGAKGDGTTDDTAAIQAAIDSLPTTGAAIGGLVYFPPGTYLVSATITFGSNVNLEGAGFDATVIKMKSGVNIAWVLSVANFAALNAASAVDTGPINFAIKNLSVDGNKTNNTTGGGGIAIYGSRYTIEHVRVRMTYGLGFYSKYQGDSVVNVQIASLEAIITDLKVTQTGGDGMVFSGPSDSVMTAVEVSRTHRDRVDTGIALVVNGGNWTGCHVWGSSHQVSCRFVAGKISNSDFEGASISQLDVVSFNSVVTGSKIYFGYAPNAANSFGIRMGEAGLAPTSNLIDVTVYQTGTGAGGGAINFVNDGYGNKITMLATQLSGNYVTGTPGNSTEYDFTLTDAGAVRPAFTKHAMNGNPPQSNDGFYFGTASAPARLWAANGAPNGSRMGRVGDIYMNLTGGALTTMWVKESGNNTNTGWVAK